MAHAQALSNGADCKCYRKQSGGVIGCGDAARVEFRTNGDFGRCECAKGASQLVQESTGLIDDRHAKHLLRLVTQQAFLLLGKGFSRFTHRISWIVAKVLEPTPNCCSRRRRQLARCELLENLGGNVFHRCVLRQCPESLRAVSNDELCLRSNLKRARRSAYTPRQ